MPARRVSEQIADWLVRQGLEQVFCVTGGGAMFLNQALGGHAQLRCDFMHHEQACTMAAEGYARIAGKLAVALVTTGPGALNAVNGVFGAYTDSIPMLVLSGQVKRETCLDFQELPGLRQLGDQEGPTIAVARTMCKHAQLIRAPEDLIEALPKAYALAVSGRPGPVWLDIPLDVQSAQQELEIPDAKLPEPEAAAGLEAACAEIVKRLQAAQRPLILAGTGVRLSAQVQALLQLAERTGVPVTTAWTHDLIASDHPLFAGRPGTIGTRPGNFALQASDFVLVLGSRLNIRQSSYNWDSFAKHGFVVQVDVDGAELHKPGVQPGLRVQADLRRFLPALMAALEGHQLPVFSPWQAWVRDINERYDVRREHSQKPDAPLNPYRVVNRVFERMRDDDVVACGNASACILPFQTGRLKADQRLFSNSGSASMGYDLPAAIGAARGGRTGRRVICFAGDGSLQMNVQELQTLKTLGLPVIVVVLNNGGYLSIWQTHENFFGRVIGATPATGVEFPDFEALAKAYGLRAHTLQGEEGFAALDGLLDEDGPLLLNVIVDPRQEFVPRIKSRVGEDGKFITPELDDMHPFLPEGERDAVRAAAQAVRAA
jgi:acetolactate synthase-1/2/3 large subunit